MSSRETSPKARDVGDSTSKTAPSVFRAGARRGLAALRSIRERVPLTNLGLAVLLASGLTWELFAKPRIDYVLQLVSLVGLGLVAVALLAVLVATVLTHRAISRRLAAGATRDAAVYEAKGEISGLFDFPVWSWLPLVDISWSWVEPEGFTLDIVRDAGRLEERLETSGRAVTEKVRRRFVIEDGFGLARIILDRQAATRLRVLPWVGRLDQAPMIRSLATGDDISHPLGDFTGDRVDMRRYVPGDPLKLALWKLYARTGVLMVRVPERAVAPSVRVAAYLPSCSADEPAAAAARVAVERKLLGDGWVFSADGATSVATDVDSALALIAESRSVRGSTLGDAAGLPRFLESTIEQRAMRVILFVPARPGPWLERCVSAARRFGGMISVVIVADGFASPANAAGFVARWLKAPEPEGLETEAHVTPEELSDVARAFASLGNGAQILALERPSGRPLPVSVRGSNARKVA